MRQSRWIRGVVVAGLLLPLMALGVQQAMGAWATDPLSTGHPQVALKAVKIHPPAARMDSECDNSQGDLVIQPCSGTQIWSPGFYTATFTFTVTPNPSGSVYYWDAACDYTGLINGCNIVAGSYLYIPPWGGPVDVDVDVYLSGPGPTGTVTLWLEEPGNPGNWSYSIKEVYLPPPPPPLANLYTWDTNPVHPEGYFTEYFQLTNTTGTYLDVQLNSLCGSGIVNCNIQDDSVLTLYPYEVTGVTIEGEVSSGTTVGTMRLVVREPQDPLYPWLPPDWADTVTLSITKGTWAVDVTPTSTNTTQTPYQDTLQWFTVKNTGTVAMTYTLATVCSVTATGCTLGVPSATPSVAPNDSLRVPVLYTAGPASAVDTVRLIASGTNAAPDTGRVIVTATAGDGLQPVVSVGNVNPESMSERGLCLGLAAGSGGSYDCGDLVLAHAFPTVRTMNKSRTLALVYASQTAVPRPIVRADVKLPSGASVPTTMRVVLSINANTVVNSAFPGNTWAAGATRRVAVDFDGSSYGTGVYPYTLTVTAEYGGTNRVTTVKGTLLIVNRSTGVYGPGWWVSGVEALQLVGSDLLWIGADGSARYYTKVNATRWVARNTTEPDVIVAKTGGGYERLVAHGTKVVFNSAGEHISTINRLGHETTFAYNSGKLTSIVVPPAAVGIGYTFNWSGSVLNSVTSQGRTVTITRVGGGDTRITQFTDPNSSTVKFTHHGSVTKLIVSRENRRGYVTKYGYDAVNKLSRVSVPLSVSDSAIVQYRPAEVVGRLATGAVVPDSAYTRLTNPRNFVTKVWGNRFGSATKVTNALNQTTTTTYDARWPGLMATLVRPNGFTTNVTYDARGNLASSTDVNPYGDSQNATTTYTWDQTYDFVQSVTTPEGVVTTMVYDGAGNRVGQHMVGSSVGYQYNNVHGLVSSVQTAAGRDSILYDSIGNVTKSRSPLGYWSVLTRDTYGRVTQVATPIDSTEKSTTVTGNWHTDATEYDAIDRVTRTTASGPGVANLVVRNFYDAESNVTRVERLIAPDTFSMDTLVLQWSFDQANRQVSATDVVGQKDSTVYDVAGNVTATRTRRGFWIQMQYDTLDRLSRRITPGDSITAGNNSSTTPHGAFSASFPFVGAVHLTDTMYIIPVDTAVFAYDVMGNMVKADNREAKIHRSYYANGALKRDTSIVRAWNQPNFATYAHQYVLQHTYNLDGQRKRLYYPDSLNAVSGGYAEYGYDTRGNLASVRDPLNNVVTFTYDSVNRRQGMGYPGGLTHTYTYDADSRLTQEVIANAPTSVGVSVKFLTTTVRSTSYKYDARGKALAIRNSAHLKDTVLAAYDGHGMLKRSEQTFQERTPGGTTVYRWRAIDTTQMDPLGNPQRKATYLDYTEFPTGGGYTWRLQYNHTGPFAQSWTYTAKTGRWVGAYFDAAGNRTLPTDGYNFYGPDDKLRAVETRYNEPFPSGANPDTLAASAQVYEYRYDALGRRVATNHLAYRRCTSWMQMLSDTLRDEWGMPVEPYQPNLHYCAASDTTLHGEEIQFSGGSHQRFVWDADGQLLLEFKFRQGIQRGDLGLEREYPAASLDNRLGGVALYVHGPGVDQPVSVLRLRPVMHASGGGDHAWGSAAAVFPHWDYQRIAAQGSFADGSEQQCKTISSQTPCTHLTWAAGKLPPYGRISLNGTWWGTLVDLKSDGAGLQYKRNRYYDPVSGLFTQEDPIGLAGGLNLYGFAGGDPIQLDDPFGLCPPKTRAEVLACTGQMLQPAQRPLEIAGAAVIFPLTFPAVAAEGSMTTLSLASRVGTRTFFRGVSAAEAADVAATGTLRAGARAAGNTGKYLTDDIVSAARWAKQNGEGSAVLELTIPADATRTMTALGRIDGVGNAWWAPLSSLKDAVITVVRQALIP